jgi:hypothetical protein
VKPLGITVCYALVFTTAQNKRSVTEGPEGGAASQYSVFIGQKMSLTG